MAHKIGLAIETTNKDLRDELLDALSELLNEHNITTRVFTITYEEKTPRGARKVVDKLEFGPGEDIDLGEFGLEKALPIDAYLSTR